MTTSRSFSFTAILLGLLLLYIGLANIGTLFPQLLCEEINPKGVHIGPNFALVYSGGCNPYSNAHIICGTVTLAGLASLGSGLQRLRPIRYLRTHR